MMLHVLHTTELSLKLSSVLQLHTVLTITYNNNTYFTVKKVLGQSGAMHNDYKRPKTLISVT